MPTKWSIAVFAHNEAETISKCLDALRSADKTIEIGIEVLVNGTTDNTMDVVNAYSSDDNRTITAHEIRIGDKSNAWNVFTHDIGSEADLYFYTDGDCWAKEGSLDAMAAAARRESGINAVSSMPLAGRSEVSWRTQTIEGHELTGNLYALTPEFVTRLRNQGVKLPVGLIGDDSMVGALAKWNLVPWSEWRKELVFPCQEAGFYFRPLSPFSLRDLRQQYKRMIRYSLRWWQLRMVDAVLKDDGLAAMPATVEDLYRRKVGICRARRNLTWFLWDALAIRRMRQAAGQ